MQQLNITQCPMCFLPYDDKEHLPYDICKESHSICFTCLVKIKNNQHTACFICKNVLDERVNRLAQQLIKMLRMMSANVQQKPSTGTNGNRGMVDGGRESSPTKDPDNSMVRTAFFPNPNEFVQNLNQATQQIASSAKIIPQPPPSFPQIPAQQQQQQQLQMQQQQQPNLQMQEHYKVISDKLLQLQTQQNEVSGKYQQMAHKNQQQPPTEQLLQLQKQHIALQQEIEKTKKYQQDLYAQIKNINPMTYNGLDPQLFNSFGTMPAVQSGRPTSSVKPQAQGQTSQKNIAKKSENIVPQVAVVAPGQHASQPPIPSGKMLPTANDNKIPNLPSQQQQYR